MSIYQSVASLEEQGEAGALCTVVSTKGSVPRHQGSKMLVREDGRIEGSVGGGEMESRVIAEAMKALAEGKPRMLSYTMVDPTRGDPGVCGGTLEVYIEPILPKPFIIVAGGGHVGKAVVQLSKWLGFRTAVADDRPEFCSPETVPGADEYYPVPLAELPEAVKINRSTFLILTTRGSAVDIAGLPSLMKTPARYIGVIGSRKRWLHTRKALIEKGVPEEDLDRIHSPMGLELQAETPEEIAVSIMAEVLQIRNGGTGKPMKY
ncbi:MAG TPA: XdhC family protein [Chloroflexi bacterium]|mgnify:CR=1 FL=1|nr:XdhC family protein [Chloroflexota bacterium]